MKAKNHEKILLLGATGKMGLSLGSVLDGAYNVVGKNSKDFDAANLREVESLIEDTRPDIVINTVAFLGIDPCEVQPNRALQMNTLYPKRLAELSKKMGFLLVHFSTDAVFNDQKGDFYLETDRPEPVNLYGLTKFGGDCFIQSIAQRYYIFRIPILFGKSLKANQFVEKMLDRVRQGQKVLKISSDIYSSPTYSSDVADEVRRIIESSSSFGTYHIANDGKTSLYELIKEIIGNLGLRVKIEKASFRDFPYVGVKNTNTPLRSAKIKSLRPWREAVKAYCDKNFSKGTLEEK